MYRRNSILKLKISKKKYLKNKNNIIKTDLIGKSSINVIKNFNHFNIFLSLATISELRNEYLCLLRNNKSFIYVLIYASFKVCQTVRKCRKVWKFCISLLKLCNEQYFLLVMWIIDLEMDEKPFTHWYLVNFYYSAVRVVSQVTYYSELTEYESLCDLCQ
jgi:hypothetical protein